MHEIKKFIDQQEAKRRFLDWLDNRKNNASYFRSGFKSHDQAAGFFQRGAKYLFAARPGIGKTALLFSLAYQQALLGVTTYFVNLEMTVEQMWVRLACLHNKDLSVRGILDGELTEDQLDMLRNQAEKELPSFSPQFFEDTDFGAFTQAIKHKIEPGSKSILFVDYLSLFSMKGLGPQEKYWMISEVARQLKFMAKALNIPIICAVQLNRKVEDRKDKRLTLADLRDSGELEQHADAVFGLTRENPERLDIDILKNRVGPAGSYDLHFDGPRIAVGEFQ